MNNLKRVLSLALSGIMLVGMMAMGASAADFTDADTIVHQDAVDILVALDVINGQDDGSFNPQGNVTRAQMAKMIAVAMKGGNDVDTGTKGTPSFTDIKGHWAEQYIEYCYDLGVISGRGDGTFAPDDNVTGIEATKMVLTALGYDSAAYKLTGASWATRADELARQASPQLYEELAGVVLNVPASRDTAAQLIWNGLQNNTKIVTPTTNTSTGEVSWRYDDGPMMLTARYNGLILTGTFNGNRSSGISACEKGEISVAGYHFPSDMDIDYIGEEVRVIYKNGVRSTSNGPDKNDTIYGVFLTGATPVVRTTRDKLAGVKTDRAVLKIDGTEYDLARTTQTRDDEGNTVTTGGILVNTNLTGSSRVTDANVADGNDNKVSTFADSICYKNGDAVKVLLNNRNEIDRIYFTTTKLAKVTSVNGDKVTLNNGVGTIKKSVNDIYEGIAKDDVVTITTLYDADATDDDAFSTVKKAEVVSGALSAYKIDDKGTAGKENIVSVTVDGTVYSIYHPTKTMISAASGFDAASNIGLGSKRINDLTAAGVLGSEVDAYMVNGFVGAVLKTSSAATNYSVVMEIRDNTESNSVFTSFQLYVMDGEGTKTIINVNDEVEDKTLKEAKTSDESVDNQTIDLTDIQKMKDKFNTKSENSAITSKWVDKKPASVFTVGDIVTYTKDKDGNADVTIEARANDTSAAGYNKDTKTFNGTVTDPNAVLFVLTKGTYDADIAGAVSGATGAQTGAGLTFKAYKMADLGNVVAGTKGSAKVVSSDKVVAGFVALGDEPAGSTSNEVFGIVAAVGSTTKVNNTNYTEYTVSVNGENRTVYVKAGNGALTKGQVVRYEPTSDNLYDNANKFALTGSKSFSAYAEEYDADRDIITFYTGDSALTGRDPVNGKPTRYEATGASHTYEVKNDVKIYAVDVDGATSSEASASSVTGFNTNTGKRNIILVTSGDGSAAAPWVVEVIVVETSGQKDIDDKTPSVTVIH